MYFLLIIAVLLTQYSCQVFFLIYCHRALGHRSTKYLYLYVQLAHVYFGGPRKYVSLWVYDREQESRAINQGYEYVRTDPKDGASLYRKAKSNLPENST